MWQRIELELPAELASITTAIWQYAEVMQLGVMRKTMLGPPCIWAIGLCAGISNLRKLPGLVDEFQQLIRAPLIYAETDTRYPRHAALLRYADFIQIGADTRRVLFERSI